MVISPLIYSTFPLLPQTHTCKNVYLITATRCSIYMTLQFRSIGSVYSCIQILPLVVKTGSQDFYKYLGGGIGEQCSLLIKHHYSFQKACWNHFWNSLYNKIATIHTHSSMVIIHFIGWIIGSSKARLRIKKANVLLCSTYADEPLNDCKKHSGCLLSMTFFCYTAILEENE